MRRTAAFLIVVAAVAAGLIGGPDAAHARAGSVRCRDVIVHQGAMPFHARRLVQTGAGCVRARQLVRAYFRAISLTTKGTVTHQGACYPQHAYGICDLVYGGGVYYCNHFNALPKKTRGVVRCGQNGAESQDVRISFNMGF
jgi:hypothetical protein